MRRLRLVLASLLILLSGCTGGGGDGAGDDPAPATPASSGDGPAAAPAPARPDVELFNDTLDFADPSGASAASERVEQAAGYGNVTLWFQVVGDCPAGYAADAPSLVVTAAGSDVVLWQHAMVAPNEPYSCSLATALMGGEMDRGSVTLAATGAVELRTTGQFTGEARVGVTATA